MTKQWVTCVASAIALCAFAGIANSQECGEIVLGAALSETGKYSANGKNTRDGYEFAIKKLKDAGGIKIDGKCYNFRVIYYDDESTPARAPQLIERLINQDKVQFVLGPYSSGMTKAVLPVTEKYQIPVVQGEGAARSLFTQGYKYHFAVLSTSEQYLGTAVDLAAELAKKAGKKPSDVKVAMIFESDPFSLDVRAGVVEDIKRNGLTTVIDDKMPRDLNDMTAFLTKVKALKPDLLLISGHEKGAATGTRQIAEMGVTTPMVGITHCESAKIEVQFKTASEGTLCPTQWSETLSYEDKLFGTAKNYEKEFLAAHKDYNVVPYQTAQATAAVYVFADALSRAGAVDREKVREALTKTDMMTFYGPVKFAPDGSNPAKPMVLRQIQNGDYVVVAPTKYASHKLVYPRVIGK